MVRVVTVGLVAVMLASATGCGGSPDSLMKQYISDLNRLADSLEKGEPKEKQDAIAEKLKATEAKLEKLKLTEDQKKALVEKHKGELEQVMMRIFGAWMKQAPDNPAAKGLDFGGFFKK